MIHFILATKLESLAIQKKFSLKEMDRFASASLLGNESIRVLITGVGKLSAAISTSWYLTKYAPSPSDLFVNFGVCGSIHRNSELGSLFQIHTILDYDSGKRFYPELLQPSSFEKSHLTTVSKPVTSQKEDRQFRHYWKLEELQKLPEEAHLMDMEASGILEALEKFVKLDRIFFFKVVSDFLDLQNFPKEEVPNWIEKSLEPISEFLHTIQKPKMLFETSELEFLGDIFSKNAITESQKHRLEQMVSYFKTRTGKFPKEILEEFSMGKTEKAENKEIFRNLEEALKSRNGDILSEQVPKSGDDDILPEQAPKSRNGDISPNPKHHFANLYVEKSILEHEKTKAILSKFPKANLILIDHYKDTFHKKNQVFQRQKNSMSIILAKRNTDFLYAGTNIAPSFEEKHFYYNTLVMNCLYNCDYCYLQGMYASANLVIFVNGEDYISYTKQKLDELKSLYVCISYDTDLLSLESIHGYTKDWMQFASDEENLKIEIRTKSTNIEPYLKFAPKPNIIPAWTLSPNSVVETYEPETPKLAARLKAISQIQKKGWSVRICLDPILDFPNWREEYTNLFQAMDEHLDYSLVREISIGTFRMPKDYWKQITKSEQFSDLVYYPYTIANGMSKYPESLEVELETFVMDLAQQRSLKVIQLNAFASTASEKNFSVNF